MCVRIGTRVTTNSIEKTKGDKKTQSIREEQIHLQAANQIPLSIIANLRGATTAVATNLLILKENKTTFSTMILEMRENSMSRHRISKKLGRLKARECSKRNCSANVKS